MLDDWYLMDSLQNSSLNTAVVDISTRQTNRNNASQVTLQLSIYRDNNHPYILNKT